MPRRRRPQPPPTMHLHRLSRRVDPLGQEEDEYTLDDEGQLEREAEEAIIRLAEYRKHRLKFVSSPRELAELGPSHAPDDPLQMRAIEAELEWRRKVRHWEEKGGSHSRDPEDWLMGVRMTQTEASLRFALHLVREGHAEADVEVSLTGRELTRNGQRPLFPVEEFLERNGAKRRISRSGHRDWRARYSIEGRPISLRLSNERGTCDVMARASEGSRILAYVGGGPTASARGSVEHRVLWMMIGRALGHDDIQPLDLLMVVVPRSERSRALAKVMRNAPRVMHAGLSICTVDRTNHVDGLPFPEAHGESLGESLA